MVTFPPKPRGPKPPEVSSAVPPVESGQGATSASAAPPPPESPTVSEVAAPPAPPVVQHVAEPVVEGFFVARVIGEGEARRHHLVDEASHPPASSAPEPDDGLGELPAGYADDSALLLPFVNAIESKDPYLKGHSARVALYATEIARTMRLDDETVDVVSRGAMLHDLGKLSIMDTILRKPERLSEDEFTLIKAHPVVGERILKPLRFLAREACAVRHHHERFDGTGYPDGLSGEHIPLAAIDWQLSIGGARAVTGSVQLSETIPAKGVAPVTTSLTIRAADAIAVAGLLARSTRDYQIAVNLRFSTAIGPLDVGVQHAGTLDAGAAGGLLGALVP